MLSIHKLLLGLVLFLASTLVLAEGVEMSIYQGTTINQFGQNQWMVNMSLGGNQTRTVIFDTGATETILGGYKCENCLSPGWDQDGFIANLTQSPAIAEYQSFAVNCTVGTV